MNDLKLYLDLKRDFGGDYCLLVSVFGKNMKYIWYLDLRSSFVEYLIRDYCSILRQFERVLISFMVNRGDVLDIVKEWVEKEGCYCEECGSIRQGLI